MRPILPGARGPAVEDIQRRLLKMGFDLGPTGVDGVFLGMTQDAVTAFQRRHELLEDGVVGQETWSALVDSTFTMGDRMLYLRLPYFHGHDVMVLQEALSALGFSCGAIDGIFGAGTEHAVRGFQRNCGQPADGIAGLETIGALTNLRHVWEGKAGVPVGSGSASPARSLDGLRNNALALEATHGAVREVGRRFVNLASASARDVRVALVDGDTAPRAGYTLVLLHDASQAREGLPVAALGSDPLAVFATRLATALSASGADSPRIGVEIGDLTGDDEALQRAAVRLLDAVCMVLA